MKNKTDIFVAFCVVFCSGVLLAALAFAVIGNPFEEPHLEFAADFEDISGVGVNSRVHYAGAPIGVVTKIEHLASDQRNQPHHVIRLHLAVHEPVSLPSNLSVSLASSSLLSERYVGLSRIDDEGGLLAHGSVLSSSREASMLEAFAPGTSDLIAKVNKLVDDMILLADRFNSTELDSLTASMKNVEAFTGDLRELTTEFRTAFSGDGETPGMKHQIENLIGNLESIAVEMDDLVHGTDAQIGLGDSARNTFENLEGFSHELKVTLAGEGEEPGLTQRLNDIADEIEVLVAGPPESPDEAIRQQLLGITTKVETLVEEIQIMTVWGQYITGTLAEKPNRIIFGAKPNEVPTKEQILNFMRRSGEPYPVEIKANDPEGDPASGLFDGLRKQRTKK